MVMRTLVCCTVLWVVFGGIHAAFPAERQDGFRAAIDEPENTVHTTRPAMETPGTLILDGRIVPGPYVVEATTEGLKVNGRLPDKISSPPLVFAISAETAAKHFVFDELYSALRVWTAEYDETQLRELAIAYLRQQPIIDAVTLHGEHHAIVHFVGEEHPEYVSLRVRPDVEASPEELRRAYLERERQSLEYWLTHGCLVIIHGGVLMVSSPGAGDVMLSEIVEIVTSRATGDEKTARIKNIIPDEGLARSIVDQGLATE